MNRAHIYNISLNVKSIVCFVAFQEKPKTQTERKSNSSPCFCAATPYNTWTPFTHPMNWTERTRHSFSSIRFFANALHFTVSTQIIATHRLSSRGSINSTISTYIVYFPFIYSHTNASHLHRQKLCGADEAAIFFFAIPQQIHVSSWMWHTLEPPQKWKMNFNATAVATWSCGKCRCKWRRWEEKR